MQLIPVLDLKDGQVVRARMGRRHEYRPIETPLSPTSDPVDVMRGLMTLHPFRTFYVADLDAIERKGDNAAVLERLTACFGIQLWVDSGAADMTTARDCLDAGRCLVLGSEVQRDLTLAEALAPEPHVILSLDFRDDAFLGPPELLAKAAHWPERVVVMSLARVGSAQGPDVGRLASIRERAGTGRRIYAAGGVRNVDDLTALAAMNIAGALVASCLHDGHVTAGQIAALARSRPETGDGRGGPLPS
jgi:phosphoribosylformimino-5-aminoimidazole carboxamide ribotide isomerase